MTKQLPIVNTKQFWDIVDMLMIAYCLFLALRTCFVREKNYAFLISSDIIIAYSLFCAKNCLLYFTYLKLLFWNIIIWMKKWYTDRLSDLS